MPHTQCPSPLPRVHGPIPHMHMHSPPSSCTEPTAIAALRMSQVPLLPRLACAAKREPPPPPPQPPKDPTPPWPPRPPPPPDACMDASVSIVGPAGRGQRSGSSYQVTLPEKLWRAGAELTVDFGVGPTEVIQVWRSPLHASPQCTIAAPHASPQCTAAALCLTTVQHCPMHSPLGAL